MILALLLIAGNQAAVLAQSSGVTPILLVVDNSGAYQWGSYVGEILRAEGLSSFDTLNLSALTASAVSGRNLVILAQPNALSGSQVTTLTNYVSGGGNLIAMRPPASLLSLFGLGASQGTLTDGYVRIDASASLSSGLRPGAGLVTETLQIHGVTDRYAPGSAVVLAQLYSNATTATANPAVVSNASGSAVAFLYDLASNVILTRQGNPANGSVDTDGDNELRTVDLFQTAGGGAPWVDRNKIPIPQADEQQRLFARLVKQAVEKGRPLPQLWYFPDGKLSMLIPTGDAHANPLSSFTSLLNTMNAANGDITIYLSDWGGLPLTNADLQTWIAQGHEFGVHPYGTPQPTTYAQLYQGFVNALSFFQSRFTVPRSRTVRNHQVTWVGWTDAADIAVAHGMGLDTNFYHWGAWLRKPDGTWPHGYFTGSGQPMKFIRQDGTILPYYQQVTQLVDEHFFTVANGVEGLTWQQALAVSQQLIDAGVAGDYAAIMTLFHVDYSSFGEIQPWVAGTLNYANSKDVPIWAAGRWLDFVEKRQGSTYTNITWNNSTGVLTFSTTGASGSGFTFATMLPVNYGGRGLQAVQVDGVNAPIYYRLIKGQPVAFVHAPPGNHTFRVTYHNGEITATPGDPPPPTEPPLTPEPRADVQVTISTMPASASPGGSLTYLYRIFNSGPNQATTVQLMSAMPAGTTFVSVSPADACGLDNDILLCDWDGLNAGKYLMVRLTLQVNSGPLLTNTALVTAVETDLNFANNRAALEATVLSALNAPEILTHSALSRSEIQLGWMDNSAGQTSAFYLERSLNAPGQWQVITALPPNMLSYVDAGLACAQTYYYRLRVYRQVDQAYSAYSPEVSNATAACPAPVTDVVGLYHNGIWHFWETNTGGQPALIFQFGPQQSGWLPITGDWDGDGTDGIGLYRDGVWIMRSLTGAGVIESIIQFGPSEPGWLPVSGDWNGDDVDGIGLYKDGLFLLRQTMSDGQPDLSFAFGPSEPGWKPVAGDWKGSGRASVGVYKDGLWLLSSALPAVLDTAPLAFGPAQPGWLPVIGDWNEDGTMTVGVYRDGLWQLRDSITSGAPDIIYTTHASSGWSPVANYRGGLSLLQALAAPVESQPPAPTTVPTDAPAESTAEVTPEVTQEIVTPTATLTPSEAPTITPTESPTPVPTESPTDTLVPTATPTAEQPEVTEEPTASG